MVHDKVFGKLCKHKFIFYLILRNADQTKPFTLDTDASDHAIRAALTQEFEDGQHPVAFFSKSLNPAEQNYNIYDSVTIVYSDTLDL